MSQQLIPINIIVADRSYRLRIEPEDEEMVRKTIKKLNEKIVDYKTNFAGKDMQDYVSMVLLWYATEQQKPTPTEIYNTSSQEKLNKIEELLNKTLSAK
ncbi:cell division protein ZapA [Segetibacter koreensis]|uniref:cell division protein ZapA n=1 Tax=Segetibacter koreensis TaxID=398037 RepID=UPI0003651CD5|nr:cell division protein ZapA [Segetibacter koreensis]